MMNEVTTICKRTVVSTRPVKPGMFHTLSVLDRVMEPNHTKIIYYYKTNPSMVLGEWTKKLRESISELLNSYPAVTGRLLKNEKGEWTVKCNDAGVRMVEAKAKGSIEGWLSCADMEKELMLVHWEDMFHKPYFWSTFYVKLTEFEEGGLAIGLSCTQLLADPICATMFIKAWADITLGSKMLTPPFFHPLPPRRPGNKNIDHKPYTNLIDYYKSSLEKCPCSQMEQEIIKTVAFGFTEKMVQSCMDMTKTLDPFEALAALFWVCVSQVKGKTDGLANMSICLDMRKVLGLDKGYFGNCMVYNRIVNGECFENYRELPKVANAIREVVNKMDVEGVMDLVEWLEANDHKSPPSMNVNNLICMNLENTYAYSAILEDRVNPIRVSYYNEPSGLGRGQILILPSAPEEGANSRVVTVTLPENEVVKLCEDVLLLQFDPTILMGVCKL